LPHFGAQDNFDMKDDQDEIDDRVSLFGQEVEN
jgi:hypothetical protein